KVFCDIIKTGVINNQDKRILKFCVSDFSEIITEATARGKDDVEAIFQYDAETKCIIPEMISMTVGRFLGRYGRFFPEYRDIIYKEINDENSVQVNIEMNGEKDNLSYDNNYCKARLILYDIDQATIDKSEQIYTLEDIFIENKEGEIGLYTRDGKKIEINCASTLSPSKSKIYRLFSYLTNLDYLRSPLGGFAKSRLELDLDYQPRIIINNLLISRERIRIDNSEIEKLRRIKNDAIELFRWAAQKRVPPEFYVYTDMDIKPRYCRLGTQYDNASFFALISNSKRYFYIEEVYPNRNSNSDISPYNMEVLCNLCLK
ncbi:MAG: hypothetical protein K6E39_03760, partial [Lachnospiraceae bacterium]|nr:hypothetical protein [Lachnospiraceae bacterium]